MACLVKIVQNSENVFVVAMRFCTDMHKQGLTGHYSRARKIFSVILAKVEVNGKF